MRLDIELINRKVYTTRARAVVAINAGMVLVNGAPASKPSRPISDSDIITITGDLPYISGRGSLKLAHALTEFGINPAGMSCLDVGASTGGFTEVLLSRGASRVIAVDVGTNQLIPDLKNNPRVISLENMDIRDINPDDFFERHPGPFRATPLPDGNQAELAVNQFPSGRGVGEARGVVDLVVIDVSFISLAHIVDSIAKWNAPKIIALIKPQFEVPKNIANKANGIIKDKKLHDFAINNVTAAFEKIGFARRGLIHSPVLGGSGNTEFLGLFEKYKN